MRISVVSPVYKGEQMVGELTRRLIIVLTEIADTYEIILVNDGSPDNSWQRIEEEASRNPDVKGIKLSRNFGQHHAISAGVDVANGDWVVVMDCDLQDAPEEIPRLLEKAQSKHLHVVLARRMHRKHTQIQRITSQLFYFLLSWLTGTKQDAGVANFGIYHHQVIQAIRQMREPIRFFPAMVKWSGFATGVLEVEHGWRAEGVSAYNYRKRLLLAIDTLLAYSNKPLVLTIKLGLFISMSALLVSLFVFVMAVTGRYTVSGYASIMMSIWFLSGLIIFIIGVLALYLAKIFDAVKERPLYIIEKHVN